MTTMAVTFDVGQTLVELDLDFLARRLGEREVTVAAAALEAAAPAAWRAYDALVTAGNGHPWKQLMTALLDGAGVAGSGPFVDWLWTEQPRHNLWRRPIAPMVALSRRLAAAGVTVGVLSNSEGRIAELLAEIGIADPFTAIIDSGKLGIEKPDRRIFDHTLAALGATTAIHIGDAWGADITGALGAGWRAIWFGPRVLPTDDPRVAIARDADEVDAALRRWGVA
jgi:FMN hydrolase / 5-amino-6-(5-phospho-D-ribitylamino)uracil phosphatase